MGIYVRRDSPFYWMRLEGHLDARGRTRREPTSVLAKNPTPELRREAKLQAQTEYSTRMLELSRADGGPSAKKLAAISFREYVRWFEQHVLPRRKGQERERELLAHLVRFFGTDPLTVIDPARVREYQTWRLDTGTRIAAKRRTKARTVYPSESTVNREVDLLKAILQSAVPKHLTVSPIYGMKRLRTTTPRRRLMTDDEEARLLAVMAADDKALFLIARDSLVRLSDVLDVKWTDRRGTTIWIADPKTGGGFEAPLSARTRAALKHVTRGKSPYIFARRRAGETARARRAVVRKMLERYCHRTTPKIPYGRDRGGLTFHWATRRTGATRMLVGGVDPGTVQKVGHWKRPDVVLSIYHALVDEKARAAVEVAARPMQREASDEVDSDV